MKRGKIGTLSFGLWVAVLFLTGVAQAFEASDFGSLAPAGFVLAEGLKPGFGPPVGTVVAVRGPVALVRAGGPAGYRASIHAQVFKGDIVLAGREGQAKLRLADGSVLTLAAESRLEIQRVLYEPNRGVRSSFLTLSLGKARFLVERLTGAKQSDFQVRTRTAVAGVRGSDFVVGAFETRTEVTAFDHTQIEVASLAAPGAPPVVLSDFERTRVDPGAPPTPPEKVPPGEIEQLKESFAVVTPPAGPSPAPQQGDRTAQGRPEGTGTEAQTIGSVEPPMVPEEKLAAPETWPGGVGIDRAAQESLLPVPDVPRDVRVDAAVRAVEEVRRELPPLPGPPP